MGIFHRFIHGVSYTAHVLLVVFSEFDRLTLTLSVSSKLDTVLHTVTYTDSASLSSSRLCCACACTYGRTPSTHAGTHTHVCAYARTFMDGHTDTFWMRQVPRALHTRALEKEGAV